MVTGDENDPASLIPAERVDQALTQARYGQAGIGSLGIGQWLDSGGGRGGQFAFADIDELDATLREWENLRDRIDQRIKKVHNIHRLYLPPAEDMMSHYQGDHGTNTVAAKLDHDSALLAYAQAYVDKLTACRNDMAATDQANTDRLRTTGEDLGHA